MHHGMDVIRLIEGAPEPVLRRFALDCAERTVARGSRAEPLQALLDTQHRHLSGGVPDAAAIQALLEVLWARDDLDESAVVGWALGNEVPAAEAAREAALEAAQAAGYRAAGTSASAGSDNEEFWQARRLRWLLGLPPDVLWHTEALAPPSVRLDFDPEATLDVLLRTAGAHAVTVLALLDGGRWSVLFDDAGVCAEARGQGRLEPGDAGIAAVHRGVWVVRRAG